jgi:hypothetical protein
MLTVCKVRACKGTSQSPRLTQDRGRHLRRAKRPARVLPVWVLHAGYCGTAADALFLLLLSAACMSDIGRPPAAATLTTETYRQTHIRRTWVRWGASSAPSTTFMVKSFSRLGSPKTQTAQQVPSWTAASKRRGPDPAGASRPRIRGGQPMRPLAAVWNLWPPLRGAKHKAPPPPGRLGG